MNLMRSLLTRVSCLTAVSLPIQPRRCINAGWNTLARDLESSTHLTRDMARAGTRCVVQLNLQSHGLKLCHAARPGCLTQSERKLPSRTREKLKSATALHPT